MWLCTISVYWYLVRMAEGIIALDTCGLVPHWYTCHFAAKHYVPLLILCDAAQIQTPSTLNGFRKPLNQLLIFACTCTVMLSRIGTVDTTVCTYSYPCKVSQNLLMICRPALSVHVRPLTVIYGIAYDTA